MEEDPCVLMENLVPVQQATIWKHRRAISLLTTAASLTGNIMALYLHFKSSVLAVMQCLYLSLLCEPPRFCVLILLLFLLLIMLVKAGLFHHEEDNSHEEVYAKRPGECTSIFYRDVGYYAEEIRWAADMEEELDVELEMGMNTSLARHEGNDEEQKRKKHKDDFNKSKEGSCPITIFDEDDNEDIEEFHKRVEAFILKVKMGFSLEL